MLGLITDQPPSWTSADQPDLGSFAALLTAARSAAMQSKDFAEVDRLKAGLTEAGVEGRMSKEGVELVPGAGFDAAKLEALA